MSIFKYIPVCITLILLVLPRLLHGETAPVKPDTLSDIKKETAPVKKKSQEIKDTVHYEAELIDYDSDMKILTLIGKSKMKYQKMTLIADTIVYNIDQSLFTASGLPMLIDDNDTVVGEQMVYNIKSRRGRVQYASTHLDDGYFNGRHIVKTPKNEVYVEAGDYTTCEVVDSSHFFFYGKKIKVIPKDKIICKPVVLNIGNTPVAALPYFVFPIEKNRRSGLLTPSWGGTPTSGGYIDNIGYYYAPNDYIDFLAKCRVAEFQDFVFYGASSYALKYKLNGSINARASLNSDFASSSRQWALDYTHNQQLTPDGLTTLSGKGSILSNKDFDTDYSDDSDKLINKNLTANMSLSHTFKKINASSNISWQRTQNLRTDAVSEDLPSISFNLPSRALIPLRDDVSEDSSHWYNKINYSYNAKGLIKHTVDSGLTSKPSETYHSGLSNSISVNAPLKVFKYITVNPSLNAQLSSFDAYMDTSVTGKDTTFDTVTYTLKEPFKDNSYTDDYKLVKSDTLSVDQYGIPDSIKITRVKTNVKDIRREKNDTLVNVPSWNAGVNLSTSLYGIFPIRIFNLAGIRHTFSPSIGYTFKPKKDLDKQFHSIGIDYERAHEQQQIVNISASNQFDGKILRSVKEGEKPAEEKVTLFSFSLSTGYDFEAKEKKWRDLSLEASTGIKMVRLNYTSSFWFYDETNALSAPIMRDMTLTLSTGSIGVHGKFWGGNILELDTAAIKFDKDRHESSGAQSWDFGFTPSYSFSMRRSSQTEMFIPDKKYSLSASANIKFTPNWSMNWSSTYNFTENQWMQNSINVSCDLECWDMQFQWRPESLNPGYYFIIRIKKIPEIKWEQRKN